MTYKRKKRVYTARKNYSIINKLQKEGKVTDRLLSNLNDLSLEELIAIKLELSSKASGGTIFGVPIWHSLRDICRDASLKFALSAARTKAEAATFLGISIATLRDYMKKYETKIYFEEKDETYKE